MIVAFFLGIATGMRTFTGLAASCTLHRGPAPIVFVLLAVGEYGADLLPQAPARTSPPSLVARLVAAASLGRIIGGAAESLAAALGALVGAFGGLRLRRYLISRLGPMAAGLSESALAAIIAVTASKLPKTFL
jgi:uncharacterized membrane protein